MRPASPEDAPATRPGDGASRRWFLAAASAGGLLPTAAFAAAAETEARGAADSVTTGSDVGSLFPFIDSQTVQDHFPLSFLNPEFTSLDAWKQQGRGKLLELLHYAPPACDPAPETLERVDCGAYTRERVLFNTTPDLRVPAIVLVPKAAHGPLPAIVALHDHGGFYLWGKEKIVALPGENPELGVFRRKFYGDKSIAIELVRQGYLVIVIDMFYWGERRMMLDDDPEDWRQRPATLSPERIQAFNRRSGQAEQLVGRTIGAAGFTWAGVMVWDDIRTIDYLLTRQDVDRQRIGCVGLSVGGLRSCRLAALDDRIRAAVVVGWMASFPRQLRRHVGNAIGHTKLIPGLTRYLDYPDVAALAAPTAVLVINGRHDPLFEPDGVQSSFDTLNACYAKAGVPERCRTSWYDTPHEFNAQMQQEAWAWLRRWLA